MSVFDINITVISSKLSVQNPLQLQEIITALVMAEDNTDLIYSFKTKKLTIESDEEVPWTLDGEFG